MKKNKVIRLILILTIVLIMVDQISKIVVQYKYEGLMGDGIIRIHLIENTGMAFGMNHGNTKNIVITVLVLIVVINFIRNQKDRMDPKTAVSLSLILAGGMSNLLDRILRGGIIDFMEVPQFAIFNLADCYVVGGWILLVIFVISYSLSGRLEK